MKLKIKTALYIMTLCSIILIMGCAGPGSVSVGVGVGVPRPYGVPPAGGSIWIGRPMPRTIYNHAPINDKKQIITGFQTERILSGKDINKL